MLSPPRQLSPSHLMYCCPVKHHAALRRQALSAWPHPLPTCLRPTGPRRARPGDKPHEAASASRRQIFPPSRGGRVFWCGFNNLPSPFDGLAWHTFLSFTQVVIPAKRAAASASRDPGPSVRAVALVNRSGFAGGC